MIAAALEANRAKRNWTQAQMAGALDMRPSHYSEIIHDKRSLPIKATRLAYALGVSAHILLAPLA
jgi:transcriptional regulator with XRE-family HTH domain